MARLRLRDYQEACVAAHFDWFARNKKGNPLFVVPTGGGKSLIIAEFIRRTLKAWPSTRILVLTHVKELIEQNHAEFVDHWGGDLFNCPAGIYSAGLKRRDVHDRVLFAGIQSIYNKADKLGRFDLVLVDECHLVPKKGMGRYLTYFESLHKINPAVRVCGYTATHYRLDGGYLHKGDGCMFHDVAYTVPVELLIERGYLVNLTAKKPKTFINTAGVKSGHGDFKVGELEERAIEGDNVKEAIAEAVEIGRAQKRKHWLIFAIGIKHAGEVAEQLKVHGIESRSVFGNTKADERAEIVDSFKSGELPALINVGVLTTGFNAPRCDMLIVMRPTQSAALYVQIMGRGMRTFPGKKDCLVLDYGENVERHGPINAVRPRKESSGDAPPPMKICPECDAILLLGTKACSQCGYEWPEAEMEREHARVASYLSPVDLDANKPRVLNVSNTHYRKHEKPGRPPSLRVDYFCGMRIHSEWVFIEHTGFAARKGARWWTNHGGAAPVPVTVDEALQRVSELQQVRAIEIYRDGDYDRVARSFFRSQQDAADATTTSARAIE